MQSLSGLPVQCPQCRRVLHTTTALYDPDKTAKGNMVELLPKWKKRGWQTFYSGGGGSTPAAGMQCPHCSGILAPSGKLRIKPESAKVLTDAEKNQAKIEKLMAEMDVITMSYFSPRKVDNALYNSCVCEICGKVCKSKLGLGSHMRSHRSHKNG